MSSQTASCPGTPKPGVFKRAVRQARKGIASVASVALVMTGLVGTGAILSFFGSSPAKAEITLPLTQMLPDYGVGVLRNPPGSPTVPGRMFPPDTYEVWTDSHSTFLTRDTFVAGIEADFATYSGRNSQAVSGYPHLVVMPGDKLIGHGAIATGMNTSGSSDDDAFPPNYPPNYDVFDLYSPQSGYLTYFDEGDLITSFTYTPGDGPCSTETPTGNSHGTVYDLWCMEIGYFTFTVHASPAPAKMARSFGFEPDWDKILADYPGIGELSTGLRYLVGPNRPVVGVNATNQGYVVIVVPRLELIKEVCSTGTGCIADVAGSAADPPVPDSVVNTGLWVDHTVLPIGSTEVEWRITTKNTGNIQLMNVHLANDVTVTDPATDDDSKLGVDNCMVQGSNFGNLMPNASSTIYCTTPITSDLDSLAVNWAQANGTIPEDVNYKTGAAGVPGGTDVVHLTMPDGAPEEPRLVMQYQGHAEGDTDVKGMVPSNNDAAMFSFQHPALKLTKWVCSTGSCSIPTGDNLSKLAGYHESTGVFPGQPAGGWVKAAHVDYGEDAQWLMIATNIGDTSLKDVTLTSEVVTDAGIEITNPLAFTKLPGPDPLPPGASAIFTATTENITNENPAGSQTTTPIGPITVRDSTGLALFSFSTGENVYTPGNDVVNKATASGTPVGDDGEPVLDSEGEPIVIDSNESMAEATTELIPPDDPNPGIKLTKWVCSLYVYGEPDCEVPPEGTNRDTLAGHDHFGGVMAGQPWGGWVKASEIPYHADAQWLMVVTNIGDTYLKEVDLMIESVSVNGVVVTNNQPFTKVATDEVNGLLPPDGHILYISETVDITTEGNPGGYVGGSSIKLGVSGTQFTYDTEEFNYAPGNDLVNEAVAVGIPTDEDGNPLFHINTGLGSNMPVSIQSNRSLAEVRTRNTTVETGGSLAATGASVPLSILAGTVLLVFAKRRTWWRA